MGCAFSGKRDTYEGDAPSFAEYDDRRGTGRFDFSDGKMVGWDRSGEIGKKAAKAHETGSFLGRSGIIDVLDTLGTSLTNLNPKSGFIYKVASRGSFVSILAFEVANTIAKGAKLMRSLSEENIQFLKKEILVSEGVQQLVSADQKELIRIAAADKREEFHVFSAEVARFGDLCKHPQWHNLTRFFQKLDSDPLPEEDLKEEAEETMHELMDLAQRTSELYHELHALDRLEKDHKRKLLEENSLPALPRGEGLAFLKHQRKLVKSLKKKSLWSMDLEELTSPQREKLSETLEPTAISSLIEAKLSQRHKLSVVEKFVDVVIYLHKEISVAFDLTGAVHFDNAPVNNSRRLGVSGLALHYANIISQIENIVSRPISVPSNTRDTLYHGLPPGVKAALRSRVQSVSVDELTVPQIKAEIQKTLNWMSPMAENTIRAHQGFGWVGEWANMGTEVNRKPSQQQQGVVRVQTLYHADKQKTEEHILQLVVWLHHLVEQVKNQGYGLKSYKPINYQGKFMSPSPEASHQKSSYKKTAVLRLSQEDIRMLECVTYTNLVLGRSKSHGYLANKEKTSKRRYRRSRSGGSSPVREAANTDRRFRSRKFLDVIDGLEIPDPIPVVTYYS